MTYVTWVRLCVACRAPSESFLRWACPMMSTGFGLYKTGPKKSSPVAYLKLSGFRDSVLAEVFVSKQIEESESRNVIGSQTAFSWRLRLGDLVKKDSFQTPRGYSWSATWLEIKAATLRRTERRTVRSWRILIPLRLSWYPPVMFVHDS